MPDAVDVDDSSTASNYIDDGCAISTSQASGIVQTPLKRPAASAARKQPARKRPAASVPPCTRSAASVVRPSCRSPSKSDDDDADQDYPPVFCSQPTTAYRLQSNTILVTFCYVADMLTYLVMATPQHR